MPENVVGCPGANVFVHPSGHVELRSTFDSLRRFFFSRFDFACYTLQAISLFLMMRTHFFQPSIFSVGGFVPPKLNSARRIGSGICPLGHIVVAMV